MSEHIIESNYLKLFYRSLLEAEKSAATIEKYLRDVRAFFVYSQGKNVTKEMTIAYKNHLVEQQYTVKSINSMIVSVNRFMEFLGWNDCKVKSLRYQRQIYCTEEKELTKKEYLRLLDAAMPHTRLNLIIQTICGTGIRISELKYFTVEAIEKGEVTVQGKGKVRSILVPRQLRKMLKRYASQHKIKEGVIFRTKNGKPMDRSNIWSQMKKLCEKARVNPSKVFPHNLRKLFARTFYGIEKDIAKLADILGHGSIDTTRIYIISTGVEHREKIERLDLVVDKGVPHN